MHRSTKSASPVSLFVCMVARRKKIIINKKETKSITMKDWPSQQGNPDAKKQNERREERRRREKKERGRNVFHLSLCFACKITKRIKVCLSYLPSLRTKMKKGGKATKTQISGGLCTRKEGARKRGSEQEISHQSIPLSSFTAHSKWIPCLTFCLKMKRRKKGRKWREVIKR